MHPRDSYYTGLVTASLFRIGLYIIALAILAISATGCSVPNPKDILPRMSAEADINRREGNQTRNDEPQSGGCHEKSDMSLRKPST